MFNKRQFKETCALHSDGGVLVPEVSLYLYITSFRRFLLYNLLFQLPFTASMTYQVPRFPSFGCIFVYHRDLMARASILFLA